MSLFAPGKMKQEERMSLHEELASLTHDDLVKLSSLVHRLLRWDRLMTWDEALQQAYKTVTDDQDWMKTHACERISRLC